MASGPSQTIGASAKQLFDSQSGRFRLARWVILGSFLTILALVAAILGIARLPDNKAAADAADKTFNVILPVLASWVGTVLAFYFSSQSLETTSNTLNQAIGQTASKSPGSGTAVSEKMIATQSIRDLINLGTTPPSQITLQSLKNKFDGKPAVPGAQAPANPPSRLVFVDKDIFRYVLHSSTFNKFLVDKGSSKAAPGEPPADIEGTFNEMLQDPDYLKQISKLVVFVAATTTLADAKTAMDGVPGAQDIIVTGTGNFSGPMLGWLTNIDLAKAMT